MRTTTLSLAVALICTSTVESFAQQGLGLGLNSSGRTNAGVGHRPDLATARGQGALRSVGRGNVGGGSASIGAQLGASGSARTGGINAGTNARATGQAHAETRGLSLHARARNEMMVRVRKEGRGPNSAPTSDGGATEGSTARNSLDVRSPWERSGLSRADWLLAKRLATLDHMRDTALQNGNERMLDHADRLEALARLQYERRTGEFAEPPSEPSPPTVEGSAAAAASVETSATATVPPTQEAAQPAE